VFLAACGGGAAAPALEEPPIPQAPAGTDREAMRRETEMLEELSRRGCACKDTACFESIDSELRAYFRDVATVNDVVADIETWPADLDARARRSSYALHDCMTEHGFLSFAYGVLFARRLGLLRDAACACTDKECARAVKEKFDEALLLASDLLADQSTLAEITAHSTELRRCLGAPGETIQQALLDLRALRKDACACGDAECARVVRSGLDAWAVEHQDTYGSPEETAEMEEIAAELGVCLHRAEENEP
jgi:hypothetical protein